MDRRAAGSSSLSRSTTSKRDARAADLEPNRQQYATKRQALTSSLAHASLERQVATLQTKSMELETKLREKELAVERLERDRRWFSDREAEERQEKERERDDHEQEKRKMEVELRSLRSTMSALKEEHADLQDSHSSLSRSTSQAIASQKNQITQLSRQVEILNEELSQTKALAEERLHAMDELHAEFDELAVQQNRPQEEQNMVVIREELHRQAAYLRQLEADNTKLKAALARNGNVDLLREEKRTLERRTRGMDELRQRVAELEGQVDASRREREEWANKSMETTLENPGKVPVAVTQQLSDLRLSHAKVLEEVGATKALLRTKEAEVVDILQRETVALERIKALEGQIKSLEGRKQQVVLLDREVGFLKALVASFQAENETTTNDRVADLEALLSEYRKTNADLTSQLETFHSMAPKAELDKEKEEKAAVQAALDASEAECVEHVKRLDSLEQELFELSGEIAGGRHVPPGVRVLSMQDNPYQQWVDIREEVVQRLRRENDALIQRLGELEGRVGGPTNGERENDNMVPRESWELVNQEKRELEEGMRQKEKRLARLQQVFKSKSSEFREAIESILGVKLAFYQNGQVRVTSIYDLTASYVFSPEGGGKMQLVAQGESSSQDLQSLMEFWVGTEGSIPGFLASVTLECWDAHKRRADEDAG